MATRDELQLVKRLGISNVVSVQSFRDRSLKPGAMPLSGVEQKFCMAVREGDKELLARLNEGLSIVIAEGIYDELYDKWFGPILPQPSVDPSTILKYLLMVLLPILLVAGVAGIWFLKREVARKTDLLRENELKFSLVFNKAPFPLSLSRLCDGVLVDVNESWTEAFGFDRGEAVGKTTSELGIALVSEERDRLYAILRENGSVKDFEVTGYRSNNNLSTVFLANLEVMEFGGEEFIFAAAQDITDRKRADTALRESEERLRVSLGEKEVMLKEIHHRVKNNMQVISSLVALQADGTRDPAVGEAMRETVHRVRSMALVHEMLYQSADLARVEFAEYARSLLNYLWCAHGSAASSVRLDLDLHPVSLPVNAAVPCGLILNELIGNALKNAFKGREGGRVTVSLRNDGQGRVRLGVKDDGVGLPPDMDWRQAKSRGLRLVHMLSGQLKCALEVEVDRGTAFTLSFERLKT